MRNYFCILLVCGLWVSSCKNDDTVSPELNYPPLDSTLNTHVMGWAREMNRQGVANAEVTLYRQVLRPTMEFTVLRTLRTDANGYFQLAFDADPSTAISYFVKAEHNSYISYIPSTRIVKDTLNKMYFSMCPESYVKLKYQNIASINCDTFWVKIEKPSGCFRSLVGSSSSGTTFLRETAARQPANLTTETNSGGYTRVTTSYYLQHALIRETIDSMFMRAGDTSIFLVNY